MRPLRRRIRDLLTTAYLRSPLLRRLHHAWAAAIGDAPAVGHLARFREEDALGPVQREEALLLFALVRMLRPRTVVELGFHRGHSALTLLLALPEDGELHSVDVDPRAADCAASFTRACGGAGGRFHFHLKDQRELSLADLGGRAVDLVLLDASHDLEVNRVTFERLAPAISPGGVLAVHDTGTWHRDHMSPGHLAWTERSDGVWIDPDRFAPWPDERRFVRWVVESRSDWSPLHLHSDRTLRHGLTLLQKAPATPVGSAEDLPRGRTADTRETGDR